MSEELDPTYVAQLYMVMKGCERELNRLGYAKSNHPSIPKGKFSFGESKLVISSTGEVERGEGNAGDGNDKYVATVHALSLKSLVLATHRNGFNMEQTADLIGDSVECALTGEVEKAGDALPEVIEKRRDAVLARLRDNTAVRPSSAKITPYRGCFLNIERI